MDEIAGVVKLVAKEGKEDALIELLGRMAAAAAADDGTELYSVHRARREPQTFFLYELYRDRDAFKRHQENAALSAIAKGLGELTDSTEILVGNLVAGDRGVRQS